MRIVQGSFNGSFNGHGPSAFRLRPIDHGLCLPLTLGDIKFVWLEWPQAKARLDDHEQLYIKEIDMDEDALILRGLCIEVSRLNCGGHGRRRGVMLRLCTCGCGCLDSGMRGCLWGGGRGSLDRNR